MNAVDIYISATFDIDNLNITLRAIHGLAEKLKNGKHEAKKEKKHTHTHDGRYGKTVRR